MKDYFNDTDYNMDLNDLASGIALFVGEVQEDLDSLKENAVNRNTIKKLDEIIVKLERVLLAAQEMNIELVSAETEMEDNNHEEFYKDFRESINRRYERIKSA